MVELDVTIKNVQETLGAVNSFGSYGYDGEIPLGLHRLAWTQSETDAMQHIAKAAELYGAKITWDKAGNLHAELAGSTGKFLAMGSHLDTVNPGGHYDGALGVADALEVLRTIAETPGERSLGFRLIVMRGEENSYGKSLKGSAAMFGELDPKYLEGTDTSKFDGNWLLRAAMQAQGADPKAIENQEALFTNTDRDNCVGYLEVHIEQDSVLSKKNVPIGIVNAISGSTRPVVCWTGETGHTAQDRGLVTRDAIRAGAESLTAIYAHVDAERRFSPSLTVACGDAHSQGGGKTKYAGSYTASLDIRSPENDARAKIASELLAICDTFSQKHGVTLQLLDQPNIDGLPMLDAPYQDILKRAAQSLDIETATLPSRASHDALWFGLKGVRTVMLFVRDLGGVSHVPDERIDPIDNAKAVEVAKRFYWELESQHRD